MTISGRVMMIAAMLILPAAWMMLDGEISVASLLWRGAVVVAVCSVAATIVDMVAPAMLATPRETEPNSSDDTVGANPE